jgi:hypothetical protein
MINAKINVTPLAAVTGILEVKRPKSNHNKVPKVNKPYMESEIPEVSRVLIVLTAWGRKETVVQKAAARPNRVIGFIAGFQGR